MSLVNTAKTAYDLAKKGMTVEFQETIMQLREEALELQDENVRLRKENRELKEKDELRKTVKRRHKVYWRDGDDVPFCPKCFETSDALLHLSTFRYSNDHNTHVLICETCNMQYATHGDDDFWVWARPPQQSQKRR